MHISYRMIHVKIKYKQTENTMINNIALENFIFSIDMDMPIAIHLANLQQDKWIYQWNRETVTAIRNELYNQYVLRSLHQIIEMKEA